MNTSISKEKWRRGKSGRMLKMKCTATVHRKGVQDLNTKRESGKTSTTHTNSKHKEMMLTCSMKPLPRVRCPISTPTVCLLERRGNKRHNQAKSQCNINRVSISRHLPPETRDCARTTANIRSREGSFTIYLQSETELNLPTQMYCLLPPGFQDLTGLLLQMPIPSNGRCCREGTSKELRLRLNTLMRLLWTLLLPMSHY